jgi:hypothetical protein
MRSIRMSSFVLVMLLLSLFVVAQQSAQAATLTVSTTADAGVGSLRQAIIDATANAAANTVVFNIPSSDPGFDVSANRFTITLASQLPDLPLAPLAIDNTTGNTLGTGVTVKGNNSFRIFTLVNSAVVNLYNLTITLGNSNGGLGGGIYMGDSAVLSLTDCVVSNNTATNGGGGIWLNDSGVMHVLNSTISNNTTANGGGGGIYVSTSGTLNLTASTVSGNAATVGSGGGIFIGISGTVNAYNATLSGNTAGDLGGGILNNATATINSSTISGNSAPNGGGGVYNNFTTTLNNDLVALNISSDGADLLGRGSRGQPFTGTSNLVGNADGSEGFGPTTNQLGTTASPINPRLGPLQNNGGPTFTHAVLAGSPALDAGTTALATDQRGVARSQDGDGVGGAQPDIGSFESEGLPEFTIDNVTVTEPTSGATSAVFTISLSRASEVDVSVDFATANGTASSGSDYLANSGTVHFAPGDITQTVTISVMGDVTPELTETYTVNLANAQGGARIPDNQGQGTIINVAPTSAGGSIGGLVADGKGSPLSGVRIDLDGTQSGQTITDSNGRYSFSDVEINGFYVVTPSRVNYSFLPNSRSFSLFADKSDADFEAVSSPNQNLNPIDGTEYFVRQQYLDFLNREPDASGFQFWTGEINACKDNQECIDNTRTKVSAAFFLSIEFQQTGYLVERLYKTAYGDGTGASTLGGMHQVAVPIVRLSEFLSDSKAIGQNVVVGQPDWETTLEQNKQAFTAGFLQRSRFTAAFPASMTAAEFVDTLNANAGSPLSLAKRNQLVSDLTAAPKTRPAILRAIAEDEGLNRAEFNRAFVLMQYFGYLQRNPNELQDVDYTGYDFWLTKMNQFNGDYLGAEMVRAFITSTEYRRRFGN